MGGWGGGYDQLCCPASPQLLFGLDLDLGLDLRTIECPDSIQWLYS